MASSSSSWTAKENKRFEEALARFSAETSTRWQSVAEAVGSKSVEEVKRHYDTLVKDINAIESGKVPVPKYKK